MELVGELVAWSAAAGAGGIAALDHETVDDAVEHRTVVERAGRTAGRVLGRVVLGSLRQTDEVGDGLGGMVAEQRDLDVTTVGVQGRGRGRNGARHEVTVCQ